MGNKMFGPRKSKFNNRFVRIDGYLFHSQKEAKWWMFLRYRQNAKEIYGLERQVRYEIYRTKDGKPRYYTADFVYHDSLGEHVVDIKSSFTAKDPVFKIKKELFEVKYNKELEIWTGTPPQNYKEMLTTGLVDTQEQPPKTRKSTKKKKKDKSNPS